ncbi:MAG: flavodoxin domain-containing protein, partial [Pseudomonadota bacterium]
MNIALYCFSATGNTRKIAENLCARLRELGPEVDLLDITALKDRRPGWGADHYDSIVLGAPIHSMRAPRLVRDWIATLQGHDKKCAIFFTYGGFQVHPTHYDTSRRLEEQGFKVVASAEFLGAHTFNLAGWRAAQGRPAGGNKPFFADFGTEDLRDIQSMGFDTVWVMG